MSNRIANLFENASTGGVAPGTLLIASPSQVGTPFEKTVVYVIQANEEGTYGVALNRPAGDELRMAWEQLTGVPAEMSCVQGGPLGGPVFALHQEAALGEIAVGGGVFVSIATENFEKLIRNPHAEYRIVFGLASWSSDALHKQIDGGLWLPMVGDAETVFGNAERMWENSLRRLGRQMIVNVAGVNRLPESPLLN